MRIETDKGMLVCDFSFKRYRKDKREMEKQIEKAKRLLKEDKGTKRTKILKNKEITIEVSLNNGNKEAIVLTSDLSCEYIRINASYN